MPRRKITVDDFIWGGMSGNIVTVRRYIKQNKYKTSAINAVNFRGYTALMYAAMTGNVNIVRTLWIAGADINIANKNNKKTALHWAAELGNTEVVRFLLAVGVDSNQVDEDGDNALMKAVIGNHAAAIHHLLLTTDINAINLNRDTALILGAQHGSINTLSLFINAGADINAIGQFGDTALIRAIIENRFDVTQFLLDQRGIEINIATKVGYTALLFATTQNQIEIVRLLLPQPGIDVNIANRDGNTALIIAADHGYTTIVSLLLAVQANPTLKNKKGQNAEDLAQNDEIRKMLRDATEIHEIGIKLAQQNDRETTIQNNLKIFRSWPSSSAASTMSHQLGEEKPVMDFRR